MSCRVKQLGPRCWAGDRSLWTQQSLILCYSASLSPIVLISLSCNKRLARSSLKPNWISMALIRLFLLRAVQQVGSAGHKTPWAVMVSEPKFSPLTMMTVFLILAVSVSVIVLKKMTVKKQKWRIIWRSHCCIFMCQSSICKTTPYQNIIATIL